MTVASSYAGKTARALTLCALAAALSAPPLRGLIEQSMVWHRFVQMPLLVLGGWLAMGAASASTLSDRLAASNRYGLTGFIAAQAIATYWMLPLAVDRAVVMPSTDLLKIATLLACGPLLRHSIARAPWVLQLFFVGSAVMMTVWLGLCFATVDLRLCNACSLESQHRSGLAIALLGCALGCAWLLTHGREVLVRTRRPVDA